MLREYETRHEILAKIIQWEICEKYSLGRENKWYEHKLQRAVKPNFVKLPWDFMVWTMRPSLIA